MAWVNQSGTLKGPKGDKGDTGTIIEDTGWNTVSILSPLIGTLEWRCVHKTVQLRFGITGEMPDGSTNINAAGSTIPAAYRPVGLMGRGPVYFSAGYNGVCHVGLDGTIGVSQKTGGVRTGAQGNATWLIP